MCEFCSNQYHLSDAKWGTGEYGTPGGTVYWSFATTPGSGFGFTSYITDAAYRGLIRDAFQAWEDVIDIDFVEVADGAQTDVRLGWDTIDGSYGVVGQASSRGSKTTETLFSMTEAEIRFDIAENWSTTAVAGRNEVGLYQVALHEIGHVLGLDHTEDPNTIMFASDVSDLSGLTQGDITGGQLMYGPASSSTPAPAPAPEPDPAPVVVPTPEPDPDPTPNPSLPYAATRGNDTFTARAGDDVIDGMGGIDTLSLNGAQSQYTLTLTPDNIVLTDRSGQDGSDMLINIERLDFQPSASTVGGGPFDITAFDGITDLEPEDFAQLVELYIAYFNRAPDALGLAFWGNAFADGMSLTEIAGLFIDQPETRATYPGAMSNADFASAVYANVLGRSPDADGYNFWVGQLDSGAVGRDTFILAVLEGAKAAPPAGASAAFINQLFADRDYLSDKTDVGAYFAVHRGMSDVETASEVMARFDGTQASIFDAVAAIEDAFASASSSTSGEFLMPLVGVLDDPFSL